MPIGISRQRAASGALPPRGFSAGMASDIRGLAEVNEACLVRLPNWEITFLQARRYPSAQRAGFPLAASASMVGQDRGVGALAG